MAPLIFHSWNRILVSEANTTSTTNAKVDCWTNEATTTTATTTSAKTIAIGKADAIGMYSIVNTIDMTADTGAIIEVAVGGTMFAGEMQLSRKE